MRNCLAQSPIGRSPRARAVLDSDLAGKNARFVDPSVFASLVGWADKILTDLKKGAKFDPYVTGGYSLLFRYGTGNLVNFGGGVNIWRTSVSVYSNVFANHFWKYDPTTGIGFISP